LNVQEGEFFTIVGPSGSGKSTLLNMLTGTSSPTTGHIKIRGEDVTALPPEKRPTSMVFQNLALFPHMSVGENIAFPLEVRGVNKTERKEKALELMEQLHLPKDFHDKQISQCSGGEKQRVAIARALANDSDIVFFDEPLSAIDYRLRKTLEVELMEVHRATGKTFIYVTHSLEEAMTMSDRLTIMRNGKIVQTGTASEIYNSPINEFVAQFLGEINAFDVTAVNNSRGLLNMECKDPDIKISTRSEEKMKTGATARLVVRPENMFFVDKVSEIKNTLEVRIKHRLVLGSRVQFEAYAGTKRILIEEQSKVDLRNTKIPVQAGDLVTVGWNIDGGILVYA